LSGPRWAARGAPRRAPGAVRLNTDGHIGGRRCGAPDRIGVEGLTAHVQTTGLGPHSQGADLEATLAWAEEENGGPLADDVALMLLSNGAGPPGPTA
jgi:hypothetical protein